MRSAIGDSVRRDSIAGDLTARHTLWDTATNLGGSVLMRCTSGNRFTVREPYEHTYEPRGMVGSITRDLMLTYIRNMTVRVADEGQWQGASGHRPVICTPGTTEV